MNFEVTAGSEYKELINILKNKSIRTVYQPIVNLKDGEILGYEALSRGPKYSMLELPTQLFDTAEKYKMLWEVELLCRTKALENAKELPKGKLLFINVNPETIKDRKFEKGTTKEYISRFGMNPSNIIFEITEKIAVKDYKSFRKTIDHYTSQGYKIAIDDAGEGYSGLRLIAETNPHYIKVDMGLIRDIDKDPIKQELLKTFHAFAQMTNMELIAEGIETINELNTLLDIGIHYGQGYFLRRPVEGFNLIDRHVKESILSRNLVKEKKKHGYYEIKIGEIARIDKNLQVTHSISEVYELFQSSHNLQGITVCHDAQPVGLVMKSKLALQIAMGGTTNTFFHEKIDSIMGKTPLILDYYTPIKEACRRAGARNQDNIYDYIIITKHSKYYGVVSIEILLSVLNDQIDSIEHIS